MARKLTAPRDTAADRARRTQLKRVGIVCVCFNLRKASRIITRRYDKLFEEVGLSATQFSILASIARHERLMITDLADLLLMERTTLTRNLKPLEKMELIQYGDGDDGDRRKRTISITRKGDRLLDRALPIWEQAQGEIIGRVGEQNTRGLLMNLWRFIYGKRYLGA